MTDVPQTEPASWHARASALAIDVLPGAVVVTTMALTALSVPFRGAWWWVAVSIGGLAILATAVNRSLLPAITGWTLGRAVAGIEVVPRGDAPANPVGAGRLLLRDLAHLLDTVPIVLGWFWPLRDKRGRTLADLLARTEVRRTESRQPAWNARTAAAAAFVVAAALGAAGAVAGYSVVYRRDQNADLARTQIAQQGPKIVADMLSYDPQSLDADFTRAQALATERYREQLVPQQDAIRGGKPVPNFYRVTDAAVLNATRDRATMLLFLQGQRGGGGKERLISATVRVTFAESAGRWRVDDLTVVSRPLPAEAEK